MSKSRDDQTGLHPVRLSAAIAAAAAATKNSASLIAQFRCYVKSILPLAYNIHPSCNNVVVICFVIVMQISDTNTHLAAYQSVLDTRYILQKQSNANMEIARVEFARGPLSLCRIGFQCIRALFV